MVKVCKIEVRPLGKNIDINNKLFYDILFRLRCEHRACANRCIQLIWEQQNEDEKFKKSYGEYPTKEQRQELYGYSSTGGLIYNLIKQEFTSLNTAILSACQQIADKKMKADRKDIFIGNKSIPNFNNSMPIELPKKNIKLGYDNTSGNWTVELALLSIKAKKEYNLKSGTLPFSLVVKDKNIRSTLEKCVDEIYTVCGSKLKYDKRANKYFLMLSFQFENTKKVLDKNNICMVHLSVGNAVECTTSNNDKPFIIKGGEIDTFRAKHEARKRSILRQRVSCGDGSVGHGIKKRVEAAYKERDIINNFKDTINHRYSKWIVEYAIKNNCGTIQLENLKGISERLLFLKTWSYFDLQNKIEIKAEYYGIEIKSVPYPKTDEELISESNSANMKQS